uniref:RRM domain-containing protein n=1 Tax=Alexandrium catenella TaxID=2925 RepID=A0A7S1W628_ALECA|mmetsp:Transcript_40735/g.110146  ORF Transcript_40735/g.110146 Transcript_40735/m.110146 type:complete len:233 (+) Transcript_40735:70-768(+)
MSQGGASNKFQIRDPDCTVWLGNLPEGISYQEVQSFMNQVGTCKRAEILRNGTGFAWFATAQDAAFAIAKLNGSFFKGSNIIVDVYTQKGGGGGGGQGSSASSASSAGRTWNNYGASKGSGGGVWKPMFQKSTGGEGGGTANINGKNKIRNPECTVWLGGLPEGTLFKDVQEHMSQAGVCKYAATLKKGTGFAVMESPEEAANAIAMLSGSVLNGAAIEVDVWEKKGPTPSA